MIFKPEQEQAVERLIQHAENIVSNAEGMDEVSRDYLNPAKKDLENVLKILNQLDKHDIHYEKLLLHYKDVQQHLDNICI